MEDRDEVVWELITAGFTVIERIMGPLQLQLQLRGKGEEGP